MLSVIVPIYNQEKFIQRAILCLKNQRASSVEYILVNDGSVDSSLEHIEYLCKNDSRFRIFSTENRGYGAACNLGIREAAGKYIAIYEPDDALTDDFYALLLQRAVQNPSADIIKYNSFYVNNGEEIVPKFKPWDPEYTEKVLSKNDIPRFWRSHPAVFNGIYKKAFLLGNDIMFCETPGAAYQDSMFIVSLYYSDPKIFIVNETKYQYTIHDNQSVKNPVGKFDSIVTNFFLEKDWMNSRNIANDSYFIYKIITQVVSLHSKDPEYFSYARFARELKKIQSIKYRYVPMGTFKENYRNMHAFACMYCRDKGRVLGEMFSGGKSE